MDIQEHETTEGQAEEKSRPRDAHVIHFPEHTGRLTLDGKRIHRA